MLLVLLACAPTDLRIGDDTPTRPPRDDTAGDPDTDPIEHLDDTGEAPDSGGDSGADTDVEEEPDDTRIFNLDAVHTVELTLSVGGRQGLDSDPYTYVAADLVFDGEAFPDVGVRIKGRLGSYRTLDQKAGLKVDLLEFGGDGKLEGLEKFNLNNMVQDCAKVHEYAAYGINRMVGVPAPRVAYATVTVDGEDYGLYSLVEDYDDEFLQKNFTDATGNLYDGDYYLWPDGNYALVDFNDSNQQYFQLDEGTDVALADIQAITDAVRAGATFAGALGSLVDMEEHAAFVAVNAWIGHYDSYTYYSNNYRVYFDPARGGQAVFLPWDPDWAFYSATAVTSFYGTISAQCYADPACNAAIDTNVDYLDANVAGSPLATELLAAIALIQPALTEDPKLETGRREIRACQDDLFDWFNRRGGELDRAGF
ncbi:MAG: CotH kinase family protein [Pseudomonadota bacterium]|nr:CotH kinase family protein [Pseudomonadota bacterium]